MSKTSTASKRTYNEKAYARLAITIPKAQREALEAHVQRKGVTVNGLVNELLRADMALTDAEWRGRKPEGDELKP